MCRRHISRVASSITGFGLGSAAAAACVIGAIDRALAGSCWGGGSGGSRWAWRGGGSAGRWAEGSAEAAVRTAAELDGADAGEASRSVFFCRFDTRFSLCFFFFFFLLSFRLRFFFSFFSFFSRLRFSRRRRCSLESDSSLLPLDSDDDEEEDGPMVPIAGPAARRSCSAAGVARAPSKTDRLQRNVLSLELIFQYPDFVQK